MAYFFLIEGGVVSLNLSDGDLLDAQAELSSESFGSDT
jgi:hypothetical protein